MRGSAVVLAVLLSALYLCTELCSLVRISVVVPVVSRSAVYLLRIVFIGAHQCSCASCEERECSAASAAELDTRAAHSLSSNQPDVKCWTKIEEEVERCEG